MASNSRLAIAIHTLGVLAFVGESPVNSRMIAKSVKTNPVVIRRIIQSLVRNGLVEVRKGTTGGSRLTRHPSEISLAEVYRSLEEPPVFDVPILEDSHECPIGRTVRPVLRKVLDNAELGLLKQLEKVSLADVMGMVKENMPKGFCNGS